MQQNFTHLSPPYCVGAGVKPCSISQSFHGNYIALYFVISQSVQLFQFVKHLG